MIWLLLVIMQFKAHPQEMMGIQTKWKELQKSNTYFWWSLGVDQSIHHLTDILIIYLILV